jgi:hypothetical protein
MGYSPATTVVLTAVVQPENLLVVTTDEVSAYYDIAAQYLVNKGMIRPSRLQHVIVSATDPRDLHDKIVARITEAKQGSVLVDVTGGKKIMSATAAQIAWELKCPLCYIDGGYDPIARRPAPGTERVILLPNPSKQQARHRRARALDLYKDGHFGRAREALELSRDANLEHALEDLLIRLCDCYQSWMDFDREELDRRLGELISCLFRPSPGVSGKQPSPASFDCRAFMKVWVAATLQRC